MTNDRWVVVTQPTWVLPVWSWISTLAHEALTPDSVQGIIQELTGKFSMAFMTTVVGLPIAAVLRTMLVVTQARSES